jgi:hypothetical protein
LVIAKLVAGREKDFDFAAALLKRGQVEAETLLLRVEDLPVPGAVQRRIQKFIQRRLPKPSEA